MGIVKKYKLVNDGICSSYNGSTEDIVSPERGGELYDTLEDAFSSMESHNTYHRRYYIIPVYVKEL